MMAVEIADGDVRSNWLPRNDDDRMLSAGALRDITGLSETASRRFVKRYGCRVGAKYWYVSYGKFKEIMRKLQQEGGQFDE